MEDATKPPVTAEELYKLLTFNQGPVDAFAYVGGFSAEDCLVAVEGDLDLKALAAWINERTGVTGGSE